MPKRHTAPVVRIQKARKGEAVRPLAMLRLIEIIGPTETARKLGVSTTLLHNARRKNLVSKVVEIGAQGLLDTLNKPTPSAPAAPIVKVAQPGGTQIVVLEVPEERANQIKRVVQGLGAQVVD